MNYARIKTHKGEEYVIPVEDATITVPVTVRRRKGKVVSVHESRTFIPWMGKGFSAMAYQGDDPVLMLADVYTSIEDVEALKSAEAEVVRAEKALAQAKQALKDARSQRTIPADSKRMRFVVGKDNRATGEWHNNRVVSMTSDEVEWLAENGGDRPDTSGRRWF
tara:strand:+ start:1563 stop:2054 length:492 start_codon:yes stop_codon:yes gene_type:complete